jgi:hypothetical protein
MNTNLLSILMGQIAAIILGLSLLYGLQSLIDSKREVEPIAYRRERSLRREAYHQYLHDLQMTSTDLLPLVERSSVPVWRKETAANLGAPVNPSLIDSPQKVGHDFRWYCTTMTVDGDMSPRTVLIRVVNEYDKEARGR